MQITLCRKHIHYYYSSDTLPSGSLFVHKKQVSAHNSPKILLNLSLLVSGAVENSKCSSGHIIETESNRRNSQYSPPGLSITQTNFN